MAEPVSLDTASAVDAEVSPEEQKRRRETERLGSDPIVPLVFRLSLPAMIGLLVSSLYAMVDRVFIGHYVGEIGMAAMNVAIPFSTVVFAFSILIGRGTAVVYSIALGRRDYKEAGKAFSGGVFLHLLVSFVIMTTCLVFMDELLIVFGAEALSKAAAREYISVVLLGTPFAMLTMHNHLIRAEGASTYSMVTQIVGALLNVGLDGVFMAGFGWGMRGAASATVISQAVSVAMVMWFLANRSVVRLRVVDMLVSKDMFSRISINGVTPFLFNAAATLNWTIQNHMLKSFSDSSGYSTTTAMASFGVVMTLRHLMMTPVIGLSMGMQPLVGYNYGADKYARVRNIFKVSLLTSFLLILIPYSVLEIFSRPVVELFGAEGDAIELGVYTLRRYMLLMPLGGLAAMFSHFFQGTGQAKRALAVTAVRQFVLATPLMLVLPFLLGYDGIVFAAPLSEVGGMLFGVYVILREFRRLRAKEVEIETLRISLEGSRRQAAYNETVLATDSLENDTPKGSADVV